MMPTNKDLAFGWAQKAGGHSHHCCFACAIGAQKAKNVAGAQVEIERIHGREPSKLFPYVLQLKHASQTKWGIIKRSSPAGHM